MDLTPPSHRSEPKSRTKSASRLSRIRHYYDEETEAPSPHLSLEIVPSSPRAAPSPSPSSTISPKQPSYGVPLHELLLLSPSPYKRSKARLTERLEMAADEVVEPNGGRRRRKNRTTTTGLVGCGSPRNNRRSRRRLEEDLMEEKEFACAAEQIVKPRKKRHTGRSKKEKLSLVPSVPSQKTIESAEYNLDGIGQLISDLMMWRDVSRTSLWFGFGSLCFISSCFTKDVNFSIFSLLSQLGLLFLGVSFFSSTVRSRGTLEAKQQFKLKEEDILRVGRLMLPAANFAISKTRELFSGEPAMTLKVVPFLLLGAEYGHLLTLRRLCALGFFISFTLPKLYSSYSSQICSKVNHFKSRALDAWGACSHKKIVASSAVSAFWNLTSIRTRIFAVFICLVLFRYHKQYSEASVQKKSGEGDKEQQQHQQHEQASAVVKM